MSYIFVYPITLGFGSVSSYKQHVLHIEVNVIVSYLRCGQGQGQVCLVGPVGMSQVAYEGSAVLFGDTLSLHSLT